MFTSNTPPQGTELDRMATDAQKRLAAFINRTAAQQTRRMRDSWGEAAATAPATATTAPVAATTHVHPCGGECGDRTTVHTHLPAQTPTAVPYPWDDITALDDPDDMTTFDLVGIAVQVATVAAFIFCAGFGLGYLSAGR